MIFNSQHSGQRSILHSSKLLMSAALAIPMASFIAGQANAESWSVNWDATYSGVNVGYMGAKFSLEENTYSINGTVKTGGLAAVFAKFKGAVSVIGTRDKNGVIIPKTYYSDQTRKKKHRTVTMSYKNGNVVDTVHKPKKTIFPGEVPITAEHLKTARDPASALFLTVPQDQKDDLKSLCNRKVRIFDANEVYDLRLAYKAMGGHPIRGIQGPRVTCVVRYDPISGHKADSKSLRRLRKNKSMELTWARLGNSNAFVVSELVMKVGLSKMRVRAR